MALNRIHIHFGRIMAAWIAVAGLMAAEHHGTVKSGGLAVPGATITATNGDKKHVTTTDENGRYSFANLPDGTWTIEVDMFGFAKVTREVGIAAEAPSPEWDLKVLSMSAFAAQSAEPAKTPEQPATPVTAQGAPQGTTQASATQASATKAPAASATAAAPKPAAKPQHAGIRLDEVAVLGIPRRALRGTLPVALRQTTAGPPCSRADSNA